MKSRSNRVALLSAMLVLIANVPVPSWAATDKAPVLTFRGVGALIATAKTRAQHRRIAQYFNQEAEKYESEARDHEEMIEAYRKSTATTAGSATTIDHCESLAKSARGMAKALREMAAAHEEMALAASRK